MARPKFVAQVLIASALTLAIASSAAGRPDPLRLITRQVNKANMLVIMDTSGSMYRLPNHQSITAGLDCYQGVFCKQEEFYGEPTSSRMATAKAVLTRLMLRYESLFNFGLGTFTQGGFFPYFRASNVRTETIPAYLDHALLKVRNCFSGGSPATSCVHNHDTFTLRPTDNSRYRVFQGGDTYITVDQNYCGKFCSTPSGTGAYQGSHYERNYQTADADFYGTPDLIRPSYEGKVITVGGTDYVYFTPILNAANLDSETGFFTGIDHPNCYDQRQCVTNCGLDWDPVNKPFLNTSGTPGIGLSNVIKTTGALDLVRFGGAIGTGYTPQSCTLYNDGDTSPGQSAYYYMKEVKRTDPVTCRRNNVLMISDGENNGPGNPADAAAKILADLDTKTYTIGYAYNSAANDAIAVAGGTARQYGQQRSKLRACHGRDRLRRHPGQLCNGARHRLIRHPKRGRHRGGANCYRCAGGLSLMERKPGGMGHIRPQPCAEVERV